MESYSSIRTAKQHSADMIDKLKSALKDELTSEMKGEFCIVATGSYARHEASRESDIDLFLVFDCDESIQENRGTLQKQVDGIVQKFITKPAGDTGTFGVSVSKGELLSNLGSPEY